MTSISSTVFDLLPSVHWEQTNNYEFMIQAGVLEIRDTDNDLVIVQMHIPGVVPRDGICSFTLHCEDGQYYISNGFWNDSISPMYQGRDGDQIYFDKVHVSGLETLSFWDKYDEFDSAMTFPSRVFLKKTWEL